MITFAQNAISEEKLKPYLSKVPEIMQSLRQNPMTCWLNLPQKHQENPEELQKIKAMAHKVQSDSEYLVCIGIGGSYLGAKAVYEALEPKTNTKLLFAGHHTSPKIMQKILDTVKDADFSVNVISKSGTTLEPALAFEPLKNLLVQKYGQELAADRIYATTDAEKGTLHDEAVANNYEMFVVPDDIGGRFSVLTAVGLFPLAVAGVDIDELVAGARAESDKIAELSPAAHYAAFRSYLRDTTPDGSTQNYDTEVLATLNPELQFFQEWWKQLFGESEGKKADGETVNNIFPASVVYSTDLHSLGQFLQDGRPNLFETFLNINTSADFSTAGVPNDPADPNHATYVQLAQTTGAISEAAQKAHAEARPVAEVLLPALNAKSLGAAIYFFELACALSATFQNVNPFDQPGVENYKAKMRQLLSA